MKKYLCLFISALMILSVAYVYVFADDETPIGPLPLVGINQTQYFVENFDDFATGAYAPVAGGIQTSVGAGSTGSFEITADKMLKASLPYANQSVAMKYILENSIETGLLAYSFVMDDTKTTGSGAWSFVLEGVPLQNNQINRHTMFVKHATSTIRNESNVALSTQPAKDANGLYHFLFVVAREDVTADWNVTAYDVSGTTPVAFYTTELSKADYPGLSAFYLSSYSTGTLATAIDDIEVAVYESYKANVLYEYDFNELDEGEYTQAEVSAMTGIETTISGGTGSFEITVGKKLKIATDAANTAARMIYSIPSVVKTGLITSKIKISKSDAGSAGPWGLFTFVSGASSRSTISLWGEDHNFRVSDGMSILGTQPKLNEETQMFHLRATLFRIDENADWSLKIYDDAGETPVEIYKDILDKETFSSIDKMLFINSYSTGPLSTAIDDLSFKAEEVKNNFVSNNVSNAVLSMEIDEALITGDLSVVISEAEDETKTVKATALYDSTNQTLNITPESYLDYGKTYKVTLSGCEISEFAFSTQNEPLKLTSKAIKYVTSGGDFDTVPQEGEFDVVCNVILSNPQGTPSSVYMLLITYDEKGMITNTISKQSNFSQTSFPDQIKIENVTKSKVAKARCFVWNKTAVGYEKME